MLVPRRPYFPHPLALWCHYPVSKCRSASIVGTSTVRVNEGKLALLTFIALQWFMPVNIKDLSFKIFVPHPCKFYFVSIPAFVMLLKTAVEPELIAVTWQGLLFSPTRHRSAANPVLHSQNSLFSYKSQLALSVRWNVGWGWDTVRTAQTQRSFTEQGYMHRYAWYMPECMASADKMDTM